MTMYPEDEPKTAKKKIWKCERCGQSERPPKSYHCPICKLRLDANYNPIYDYGAKRTYRNGIQKRLPPSYNMTAKDEAPEYD